jgi:hypothetical protein
MFILGFGILTQYVPYFKLVGDGYKYFMWGAFPTAVVLAVTLPLGDSRLITAGYLLALVGAAVYSTLRIHFRVNVVDPSSRTITTDGAAVLDFLERADGNGVLLLPFGMSFHVLYETDLNILFHQNPKIEAESAFPVPIEPLSDIVSEYEIDHVVVDTTVVDVEKFNTEPFREMFEDEDYVVLQPDR